MLNEVWFVGISLKEDLLLESKLVIFEILNRYFIELFSLIVIRVGW